MNIKVLVATHKPYFMPADDMYVPVQVNAAANGHFDASVTGERFEFDDTGDNISLKNPYYCELTALYWGWKNLECDYMGLVHYRRYLGGTEKAAAAVNKTEKNWNSILSGKQTKALLEELSKQDVFVILPKKRFYIIETLYSHYAHSHYEADLIETADVIFNNFPEYSNTYTEVMKRRSSHMFNMCIMRRDILDEYCRWLFDVLGLVEAQLDISSYSDFDKRVFGRLSELLLDVWITKNNISYHELPLINIEGENWPHKILLYLRRKIRPEHA